MPQISQISTDFFHKLNLRSYHLYGSFQKYMVRNTFSLLLLLNTCFFAFGQTVKADDILGNWLTGSKKGVVQIYKDGNKYSGKIIWLKNPTYEDGKPKLDKHNPDKAKQTGTVMGLNMLAGFVFENDKWIDGTIYDPENGKTYSCKITKKGDMLSVRGFIGISLIGRTDTWYKVQTK